MSNRSNSISESRRNHSNVAPKFQFDEQRVNAIFTDLTPSMLPGVAVGIAVRGRPVYRKGFGLASMELPYVLSPSTRMRIGSTSKQFTALAYLLLCEDGNARLDDSLGTHFPEFSPALRSVTMFQLLGHISGIRDATDIRFRLGGFEGRPITSHELLSLYCKIEDFNAPPGSTWIYNNAGYMLLGSAVERISGQSLQDFLWDRIFSPIGMYDTSLRPWDTTFTPNTASPHTLMGDGTFQRRFWGLDFAGAGSMLSTVDDLLRWLAHMRAPVIGSRATWDAMLSPQILSNGTSTGYGGGLIRSRYRGLDTINHGGGWIGGNAQILKVPALDLDIVVISNRSDVFSPVLANRVLDVNVPEIKPAIVSGREPPSDHRFSVFRIPPKATAPTLAALDDPAASTRYLTGTFRSPKTGRIVQLFPENGMQIVSIDAHDLPYERDANGDLVPISVWSHIKRFIELPGSEDLTRRIRLMDFGEVDELTRVEAGLIPDARPLAGEYRSNAVGAVARVTVGDDGVRLRFDSAFGSNEYSMVHICERSWRITSPESIFLDALITFNETYDIFRMSAYNVRDFLFNRAQ